MSSHGGIEDPIEILAEANGVEARQRSTAGDKYA
jgi:hypothetical protein